MEKKKKKKKIKDANVTNISAMFQFHPSYGFWGDDFFFFSFFANLDFWLPWQPIKFSVSDKIDTFGRGILKDNFCKTFVKIFAVR